MWTVTLSWRTGSPCFLSGGCGTTWNLAHYMDFRANGICNTENSKNKEVFRWMILLGYPFQHTKPQHHSCLATKAICHFVGVIIHSISPIYWMPRTRKELCQEQWEVQSQSRQEFCPQEACSLAEGIRHQHKELKQRCMMINKSLKEGWFTARRQGQGDWG